ncbi:MAG: hypothetical protein M1503_03465 [Thaumarchaeota archaeon]|nr:hypothetical protein [Nitrososphaerota archaeon]MCL5317312.1 hypothetical protein [Nitrososphaerota archaeon]
MKEFGYIVIIGVLLALASGGAYYIGYLTTPSGNVSTITITDTTTTIKPVEVTKTITVTNTSTIQGLETTRTITITQTVTTKITTPNNTETPVVAEVTQNNFTLSIHMDKATFRSDEQVIVLFNLSYLGDLPIKVQSPAINDVFRLRVWNQTRSIDNGLTSLLALKTYIISKSQPILGQAVIDDDRIVFYVNGGSGPGGGFIGFSPGSTYYIQGSAFLYLGNANILNMTAPPLNIRITK